MKITYLNRKAVSERLNIINESTFTWPVDKKPLRYKVEKLSELHWTDTDD